MKNFRLTFLVLSIAVVFVIASILWRALHTEGGVESVGCGYGNLWIQYAWHDRGLLRSSKVDWLIVMPEFPKHKEYDSLNGWRFRFENGRKFEFQPDRSNVIWVDPTNGPRKIPTELTKDLIKKIGYYSAPKSR